MSKAMKVRMKVMNPEMRVEKMVRVIRVVMMVKTGVVMSKAMRVRVIRMIQTERMKKRVVESQMVQKMVMIMEQRIPTPSFTRVNF